MASSDRMTTALKRADRSHWHRWPLLLLPPGQHLLVVWLLVAANPSACQEQPSQYQNTTTGAANSSNANPDYLATGRKITGILDRFMSLGYDKRVRPNYGGPPVQVNVTMRIISISSVSEVMMDFTGDFYFRQTWHDPRLAFKKLNNIGKLYVGAEVSKKIWLPDTFFGNEKMAYFHEATTPNVFLRIDHSGEVYRSIRLTVTSSCPMNLQYFPMDRQRCTIEAESYGYDIKDITYRWSNATAVERDKEISLPQFDIVRTVQTCRLEELSSGTYSRLIAEIHFARRMGYYLIQIYIPSSLIVVISWVSFWLHRNASPARVQLGVTTVLTMTTLMSSTNAALPKISYVKSIDIFLGTCFIMVFAALLEYATVGYLGKRIAMRKAQLQHAQSQAQAKLFAQLQAQGDSVPLTGSASILAPAAAALFAGPPATLQPQPQLQQQQQQQQQYQANDDDQHLVYLAAAAAGGAERNQTPPEVPERGRCSHCSRHQIRTATSAPTTCAAHGPCPHHQRHSCEPRRRKVATTSNTCSCACAASQTLPRNLTFAHDHDHSNHLTHSLMHCQHLRHQHHQHHRLHQQHDCDQTNNQPQSLTGQTSYLGPAATCCGNQPPTYGAPAAMAATGKGAKAAANAAATFVNIHRRNRGLPPSTNPNFAHLPTLAPFNRHLETFFGVHPSDIDKYSRVVFPVCFVCFQLMYWIVYLHISAFLDSEQLQNQQPSC